MIEVAPKEYWKQLTMQDAKLYCFTLNINGKIGWRLPTEREYFNNFGIPMICWNQRYNTGSDIIRETVPVRDVN